MGRTRTNTVYDYFDYCKETDLSTCKIPVYRMQESNDSNSDSENVSMCNAKLKGNTSSNLEKHVRARHKDEWTIYNEKKQKINEIPTSTGALKRKHQSIITDYHPVIAKTRNICLSYKQIEDACVTLVTRDGRPFSAVEDDGFKMILQPLLTSLDTRDHSKKVMNRRKIRDIIIERARTLRGKITEKVSGNLISLKVDCATRHNKSFMGVNIQFRKNQNLSLYTLGILEMDVSHSAINLKQKISEILEIFDIKFERLYSITTDNAANFLASVKLINSSLPSTNEPNTLSDGESDGEASISDRPSSTAQNSVIEDDFAQDDEYDFDNIECFEVDADENAELNNSTKSAEESLLKTLEEAFQNTDHVIAVRCATHSLQLAVLNALDKCDLKEVEKARDVVKILRTETYMREIRKQKLLLPIMDCKTRWGSCFNMLNRLHGLKKYVNNVAKYNPSLKLEEAEWDKLKIMIDILQPIHEATIKLQAAKLNMSDFFLIWMDCLMNVKKYNNQLATEVAKQMEGRSKKLFSENMALASCLLLDPRFKHFLNDHQQNNIMSHLGKLYERIQKMKGFPDTNEKAPIDTSTNEPETEMYMDELSRFLAPVNRSQSLRKVAQRSTSDIRMCLEKFIRSEPYPTETDIKNFDICKFWQSRPERYPELWDISDVVFAVPATQNSVERLFSHLKFIYSDQRASLDSSCLNDIIFLRLNNA